MRCRPLMFLSVLLLSLRAMSAPITPRPASTPLDMMSATVQIEVEIDETVLNRAGEPVGDKVKSGWVGSGVVYAEKDGKSLILSANHVLETPEVGSIETDKINLLGMELVVGHHRVDAVKITVNTFDGRTCNAKPLVLGHSDERDVATAEVDCDAGRVAVLAHSIPARGEKVFISGHPQGVPVAIVTDGYVGGQMKIPEGTFMLVSASAWGGNSGGPVFYNGKVVGLLVRGSRAYPHISLVAPLEQVLERVSQSPSL